MFSQGLRERSLVVYRYLTRPTWRILKLYLNKTWLNPRSPWRTNLQNRGDPRSAKVICFDFQTPVVKGRDIGLLTFKKIYIIFEFATLYPKIHPFYTTVFWQEANIFWKQRYWYSSWWTANLLFTDAHILKIWPKREITLKIEKYVCKNSKLTVNFLQLDYYSKYNKVFIFSHVS